MNLRSLVRGSINAVNCDQQITWQAYQGYTETNGVVTPIYGSQAVWAQIQPVPTNRLTHLDNLNIQGVLRQVYLRGAVASAVRADGTGGDLLQFPEVQNGPLRTWLVELVDEQWPTWCKVTVRLQNDQNSSNT